MFKERERNPWSPSTKWYSDAPKPTRFHANLNTSILKIVPGSEYEASCGIDYHRDASMETKEIQSFKQDVFGFACSGGVWAVLGTKHGTNKYTNQGT